MKAIPVLHLCKMRENTPKEHPLVIAAISSRPRKLVYPTHEAHATWCQTEQADGNIVVLNRRVRSLNAAAALEVLQIYAEALLLTYVQVFESLSHQSLPQGMSTIHLVGVV